MPSITAQISGRMMAPLGINPGHFRVKLEVSSDDAAKVSESNVRLHWFQVFSRSCRTCRNSWWEGYDLTVVSSWRFKVDADVIDTWETMWTGARSCGASYGLLRGLRQKSNA